MVAGDGLLHPVAMAAIALLILNDHVLKSAYPGPITGKISDFMGLLFFPLAVQAAVEIGARIVGRDATANQRVLLVAIAATGIVFTAVKLIPEINVVAELAIGWLQVADTRPRIALDATDLIALPALLMAWHIGAGRVRADLA
ncbi:MAG TPA: hypothetical protein VIF08_02155 [Candidatus Limnocylindrales bacterium]|jgi:hypothetical protein